MAHASPRLHDRTAAPQEFILGEFPRTLDERLRLSIPPEFAEPCWRAASECILAKERPGCLSLWNARLAIAAGQRRGAGQQQDARRQAGRPARGGAVAQPAAFDTTQRRCPWPAAAGLSMPEGFREFLQVEPGGEVIVVGAGVCVEIWNPRAWLTYLEATHA